MRDTNTRLEELENRIGGFEEGAKHREIAISKLTKATIALGLLIILILLFGGLFTVKGQRTNARTAHQAIIAAHTAHTAFNKVAETRRSSIKASCNQQNTNHDSTIKQLKKFFGQGDPAQRELSLGIHYLLRLAKASSAARIDPIDTANEIKHFSTYVALQEQEIRNSLQGTIFLIDKLQPHKNCQKVVKDATTS